MEKTTLIILLSITILLNTQLSSANITVSPAELTINIDDIQIDGNTTKKITVTNKNNYTFNVTWYLEHPNPENWIRPNKTRILNLSWIKVTPNYRNIPPNEKTTFFIYLKIPYDPSIKNKHWETWLTFKQGKQKQNTDFINYENAVRIYTDIPDITEYYNRFNLTQENNDLKATTTSDNIINTSIIIIFIIIATALYSTKKKTKK